MIKILIIDDEVKKREMHADIINLYYPDAKVVGFAQDVKSGIAAIEKYNPDVVLLDIQLPDGTGFDILTKIPTDKYNFHVIFITAHKEYALKAFRFSAIDYLLKPVDSEELIKAIEKCKTYMKDELKQKIETHSYNLNEQGKNKKIVLKTLESIHIIEIKDIVRCQSDGNYTTFYITDKKEIMVSRQLKEYEEILKEYNFFRTHQSHLINLDYVLKYEKRDGGYVVMKDESIITVSQRKKDLFLKIINNL